MAKQGKSRSDNVALVINLSEAAGDELKTFSDMLGAKQKVVISKLVEWFASQDLDTQVRILRDAGKPRVAADLSHPKPADTQADAHRSRGSRGAA